MQLWLLNSFSTPVLVAIVVGGLTALALAGALLLHRRFPSLETGKYNDAVGMLLGVFGAIYGIVLAFVIVTLWTQLETTETVVATEATDVAQIVRDVRAFPPDRRDRIVADLDAYVHTVVEYQWPRMREGRADHTAATPRLDRVYADLQAYEPRTAAQQAFYEKALDGLDDIAAQRRARLRQSSQQLPLLFQVLVFGGALVVLAIICLFGNRRKSVQILFVGSVAVLIGFSLLLVIVLDLPFSGDLSVDPDPYREGVLAAFWRK
ncbi:DUF4239 domain-containing protein [Streptomyces sp. AV19]|uniref:bestrophin-like domain n=1 Tax=Streptomyces sp. AV19 TaxID=2793068 RepID=UPI0018FE508C|nr:DUF4239 domain-containing protein [Streptomyces sp. AV19]MBH1935904.1 DUF4239 domain-containing protein [Streptomyces sp. AV19]MDG4534313.1 DUF4239 domain-containing protein [Streptomyces sp. AV19]